MTRPQSPDAPSSGTLPETAPHLAPASRNPTTGILLKIISVTVFVGMATCIKAVGEGIPAGEIVFFRSAFAMVPIFLYLAWQGDLSHAFETKNPLSHFRRGLVGVIAMGFGFYGITRLPLPDAIALGYAMPLLTVVFAAVFLREVVRLYRWSAVAVGIVGVLIISWPKLTLLRSGELDQSQALGVLAILASAALAAVAMVLVRKLVQTEKTPTIVLYFSLSASVLALATIPFGWVVPDMTTALLLMASGCLGGIGQILLTQSYRYADVSTIAPFEYTSIIWGLAIGYAFFGDIPETMTLVGTAIVISAGIFIIFRERSLGLKRQGARRVMTPQG